VIGTQLSSTSGTSLNQHATVLAGETIFVTIATEPTTSAVTVTDSAGNTYSKDADVTNGSGTAGVRTPVFSWPYAVAFNGTVTVNLPSPTPLNSAATFFSFPDLLSPIKDKSNTATGSGMTADSGSTTATSNPDELLIGAIGWEDKNGIGPGPGFVALPMTATSSGPNADNVMIAPEYQLVNATGTYNATGVDNKNMRWAAAIVTYRQNYPTVSSINRADANPNGSATVNFTVTFSENVYGVSASDFMLAISGVSSSSIDAITGSGTTYNVAVNTGTGNGSIGLNLVDHD